MKGDLTWRGEHTVQYADDVLQNCTPDTYKILFIFLKIYLFLDRGEGWERNINVWVPLECPLMGTWHATQACALTGN